MMKTAESIAQFGVMTPAIARPRAEGGYELIAGHRRHHASQLAGKETMPVIVRDLDDDAATILMVDSNLQREALLPSERASVWNMACLSFTQSHIVNEPKGHFSRKRKASVSCSAMPLILCWPPNQSLFRS